MDHAADVRERYRRFAEDARERSALYAEWAAGVAGDEAVSGILARIPPTRRQPPLVFASTRMRGAPEQEFDRWREWVLRHADDVVAECSARSLQTNEPQRCAALLPALALIEGPIALLEVGASAGLCLFPDRYGYTYASDRAAVTLAGEGPHLTCRVRGERMPRLRHPEIVWRAGIDLHPLDAADPDDRAWLTALVWPGERGRAARISAALDVVAADPPVIHTGDAADLIAQVAAQAPGDARLVVTTPGVLPHIPRAGRERVIAAARTAGTWITLDPLTLGTLDDPWGLGEGFVLGMDGRVLARADPLGGWLEWLPG